jgi:NAD-dependent SIR2 family protein deacetylase
MGEDSCINCGASDTERYELLVRNTNHDEVPLCDACYEAIQQELDAE